MSLGIKPPKIGRMLPFTVVTCVVVIGGCAHYTPKPLAPAQTAVALESRTLSDPGLRSYIETSLGHRLAEWPVKTWDLKLLTLAAFYYSPVLDVARTHWKVTTAGIRTARALPNPSLSLVPDYSTNPPLDVGHWMPSIALDVPLETAGKRADRILEARELAEAARWEVISTAWHVRRKLTRAFLDYSVARRRTQLLESLIGLEERATRLEQGELAAGAVAGSDLTALRVQTAKDRLELQNARADLVEARARCADALGVPLRALREAELSYDFHPPDATALSSMGARRRALRSRSDVMGALARYEAAQAALQLEVARQYPDLHLGPGYAWNEGENMWSLGLTLELPILNQNQGPIAEAAARRSEAAAELIALQAKVIHEVDSGVSALNTAKASSTAAQALLVAQRQSVNAMEAQHKAGAVGALGVIAARIDLINAENLVFAANVKQQRALRVLEDALQRPLGSEGDARAIVLQIESTQGSPRREAAE